MDLRRAAGWIVVVGALASSRPCLVPCFAKEREKEAAPPPKPTPQAIDAAIERGVAWLGEEQDRDGAFSGGNDLGHTALASLAMLHAGLREGGPTPGDKTLTTALAWLDREAPGRRGKFRDPGTYTTSLLLLVYRARAREEDRARMQRLVDLLVLTQAKNGQWGYSGFPAFDPRQGPDVGDNSNTHFAVLGLGTAVGEGLVVPDRTLRRALMWWRACGQQDGGFGYSSGGSLRSESSGSMTAAGIACLAVLGAALEQEGQDPVLRRAVERLARGFTVEKNFGPEGGAANERQRASGRGWIHYYLWTVERALVLAGLDAIGGHDWFAEGTVRLLTTQHDDGSWRAEHPLYATSFALLFLSRAADRPRAFTPPPSSAPTTPGEEATPTKAPMPRDPPPPGGPDAWLRGGVPPLTLRDHCLAAGPTKCLMPLARALEDADPLVRRRAFETLSMLLPADVVAGADVRPLPRGRLALWIRRHARLLDVATDRFVLP